MADDEGFLSRWSRRKVQVQQGLAPAAEPAAEPAAAAVAADLSLPVPRPAGHEAPVLAPPPPASATAEEAQTLPPPPTLDEALRLTPADDFSRFVGRGVDPQVSHTALKTLFSDPHFNVMDGLDTYIDDYNTPDPLPAGMLRQMVQSGLLGLFDDEPADPAAAAAAPPPTETPPAHEDAAVRLQPNDDAGPAGDQPGPGEDPGRQL
jgi:hypothetical protein